MKKLFALTENEQRVVIVIMLLLVTVAFTRHHRNALETPSRSIPPPISSPTAPVSADEEQ